MKYHKDRLLAVNWEEQFAGKCAEEMWTTFKSELTKQIEDHIPLKKNYKPKKKDYISKATKKHMKKRSKAQKKYRQFPSGKNFQEYKKIRNEVNVMEKSDEDAYRKRIISGFKQKQPKKVLWIYAEVADCKRCGHRLKEK